MFLRRGKLHKQETARRIPVPTLFLFGEQDFAIDPRTVRGVGASIDAPYREVRFAHSGHWIQEELPLEVNQALMEFIEG
jgi:pimeloyl-ACP methyl ester carboxylesterase